MSWNNVWKFLIKGKNEAVYIKNNIYLTIFILPYITKHDHLKYKIVEKSYQFSIEITKIV